MHRGMGLHLWRQKRGAPWCQKGSLRPLAEERGQRPGPLLTGQAAYDGRSAAQHGVHVPAGRRGAGSAQGRTDPWSPCTRSQNAGVRACDPLTHLEMQSRPGVTLGHTCSVQQLK